MKYVSERFFKLWFYSVSHSSLIIRSELQFPDVEYAQKYIPNCTIDVEFWGVSYMETVTNFEGLIISEEIDSVPEKILKIKEKENLKVFKLESITEKCYIIAAGLIVGTSMWTSEDRLHNPRLNYEEELFSL